MLGASEYPTTSTSWLIGGLKVKTSSSKWLTLWREQDPRNPVVLVENKIHANRSLFPKRNSRVFGKQPSSRSRRHGELELQTGRHIDVHRVGAGGSP